MLTRSIVLTVASILAVAPSGAHGQIFMAEREYERSRGNWLIDLGPQYAQAIGDFRTNVERAWGFGGSVRYGFPQLAPLGVRFDGAFFNYGNERKRVQLSPTVNRVLVDMNTSNNIALFTLGPELAVRRGPVRPYAFAFAGFSYLYTQSSVGDDNEHSDFASTTNYDDGGWATGWGGGLRLPLNVRRQDIAIDVGARMTRNGTRNYLREGDIIDQADGSLQFTERRTTVEFVQYQIGVSFAPPRRSRR